LGIGLIALCLLFLLFRSIFRIIPEYKRLGVYRGGVFVGDKAPGIYLTLPFLDRVRYVDARVRKMRIDRQMFMSSDGKPIQASVLCFHEVSNPYAYLNRIFDYEDSLRDLLISSVTMVMSEYELDDILPELISIQEKVFETIQREIEPWGGKLQHLGFLGITFPPGGDR
jgi:regulator of protease activity HflC (stomatin/prohibitin superfamily)